jgi:hypothetical protein
MTRRIFGLLVALVAACGGRLADVYGARYNDGTTYGNGAVYG